MNQVMSKSSTTDDMSKQSLLDWQAEDFERFGKQFLNARHNLHLNPLFSRQSIVDLIDSYPRAQLQAFTMGGDPSKPNELTPVDTTGAGGAEILEAVNHGKLWFKLQRIDLFPEYGDVIRCLFDELSEGCPDFHPHKWAGVVLFGSTDSLVYFHADSKPNLLWHIWGRKRCWLYPAPGQQGGHLVDQDTMEDIYASIRDEEVDYQDSFEQYATMFDLGPGDVLSWPQNSPHRLQVLEGISMSISCFYETDQSVRRSNVYGMNRILRTRLGVQKRSIDQSGIVPSVKSFGYRALRRAGMIEKATRRPYMTDLRIDGQSETGVSRIETGPRLTEFAAGEDL